MKILKAAIILAVVSTSLFAQNSSRSEKSVESEYLSDSDGLVVMSLATSQSYDNKLVALEYLQSAIDKGNTSEQVIAAVSQLAGEGLNTQVREKGRLVNNFPDVRREACLMMGKISADEKTMKQIKTTLVTITTQDSEPMVMAAAIRALGEIGMNNNDEVVQAISFANRRNQATTPTSSMALEVLNAMEKLAPSTENKRTIIDTCASIAADYHYVTPVRNRALALIKSLGASN